MKANCVCFCLRFCGVGWNSLERFITFFFPFFFFSYKLFLHISFLTRKSPYEQKLLILSKIFLLNKWKTILGKNEKKKKCKLKMFCNE